VLPLASSLASTLRLSSSALIALRSWSSAFFLAAVNSSFSSMFLSGFSSTVDSSVEVLASSFFKSFVFFGHICSKNHFY